MEKSKVYFTDMRTRNEEGLPHKLQRLMASAGIASIDMDGRFVAIKMHFGELGNLGFLRPNYAAAVAEVVSKQGGKPFLTDCNTLYPGSRKNALEHLRCAYANGFSPLTTGCAIIIGDGLKGTDEALVPVVNGEYVKQAKIGRAVMDADVFISLTHFKGHGEAGFGGALKNIGMGCGSRAGKMEQHNQGVCRVDASRCRGCHLCQKDCQQGAISYGTDRKASIDPARCVGCGHCIGACNFDAIAPTAGNAPDVLSCKIAEYAQAVCHGRPCFHIALAIDIAPDCDCYPCNDANMLPDIGMFASFDPVALDQACADACMKAEPLDGSALSERLGTHRDDKVGRDWFRIMNPDTCWQVGLDHAVRIGLGSRQYDLVVVR